MELVSERCFVSLLDRVVEVKPIIFRDVFLSCDVENLSDRSCESGLASLYAVGKLSTFHSHKGE